MAYNPQGNLSAVILPNGRKIEYKHDRMGLLKNVSLAGGPSVNLVYDRLGRIKRREYSNGVSQFVEHTPFGRTAAMRLARGDANNFWERAYKFAPGGDLIEEFDGTQRFKYVYENDRLVKADLGRWGILKLGYDKRGNRAFKEWDGKKENYAYNSRGQLVRAGSQTFRWDSRGNLVERKGDTGPIFFAYNGNNQLERTTNSLGESISYAYDALGRLISTTRGAGIDYIVHVGQFLLLVVDEDGMIKQTTVSEDLDRPLFSEKNGMSLFYHQNILDNVTCVTNEKGKIVDQKRYSPFGTVLTNHPDSRSPAYGARPYNPIAGLYDMRFRQYDPSVGIFLTPDPIFSTNPYGYVENNPLKFKDPFGLEKCERERQELHHFQKLYEAARGDYVLARAGGNAEIRKRSERIAKIEDKLRKLKDIKGGWKDWYAGLMSKGSKTNLYWNYGSVRATQVVNLVAIPGFVAMFSSPYGTLGGLGWGVVVEGASSDFGKMSTSTMVEKLRSAEKKLNDRISFLTTRKARLQSQIISSKTGLRIDMDFFYEQVSHAADQLQRCLTDKKDCGS
jgi:RHS repeat-associated protein